jgi:hypothetical protein
MRALSGDKKTSRSDAIAPGKARSAISLREWKTALSLRFAQRIATKKATSQQSGNEAVDVRLSREDLVERGSY